MNQRPAPRAASPAPRSCRPLVFLVVPTVLVAALACFVACCGMAGRRSYLLASAARAPVSEAASSGERFSHPPDNPFTSARDNPRSTFSIDVDTASYSVMRSSVSGGALPPVEAVRVEEMLNYFAYETPAPPRDGAPLAVAAEVGPCPWAPRHRLVRLALRAQEIPPRELPPRHLTFLIDVSGSMSGPDRLPLVRRSLELLVETLTAKDSVAIVVYAGSSGLVLPPTSGAAKETIREAIARLEAGGSTNGGEGIVLAYHVARAQVTPGSMNRVILATDGDFNVGLTDERDLVRLIEEEREHGVFLTVLGYGRGNLKDATMESLADHGNGNYAYIDSFAEARRALVEDAAGTLITVAKDVKLQVEMNPARVARYRLIGYEDRLLRQEDFANDRVDAGDLGSGQRVTALYEVEPAAAEKGDGELLRLDVRAKPREGGPSALHSWRVKDEGATWAGTSADFRFAAAVAAFGLALRESPARGEASFALARKLLADEGAPARDRHRVELLTLVTRASDLRRR